MNEMNLIIKRAAVLLPGWVFLLAGLGTIMACLIMPALAEHQMMRWRKQTLRTQVQLLERQAGIYQKFDTALTQEDPILLQRLAYTQLGLVPRGGSPVEHYQPLPSVGESTYTTQHADGWFSASIGQSNTGQNIYESVLEPGQMPPTALPPQMANTRFVRLTSGALRPWVMLLGLLGVILGLMASPSKN